MTTLRGALIVLTALLMSGRASGTEDPVSPETSSPRDQAVAEVQALDSLSASSASGVIAGVMFDWISHRTMAQGSDNWPATWASDDAQYAIWGDGGGFGGNDSLGRSSFGVARIEGDSDNYQGINRYGGLGGECAPAATAMTGKSHGAPLSIGGVLYAWVTPGAGEMGYESFSLYRSTDRACHWVPVGVTFSRALYGISFGSFVQFGKDNGDAIDAYVYTVATAVTDNSSLKIVQRPGRVMLLRVPAASIEVQGAYEFFAGLNTSGQPTWSTDKSKAVPTYNDAAGVGPFAQMAHIPGLGPFVYTNQHGNGSSASGFQSLLTMAEAPRPWGPWTVFYRDVFSPAKQSPAPISVNLSAVGNVYALVNDGTRVPSGGIDGWGDAYSETLTGTSISWSGMTFTLGASGTANGVRARTVPLPAGNYSNVLLLATAVNGKQPNQQFVVTYTDGSSANLFPQSLSDWYAPLAQHYVGESIVAALAHRVTASGAIQNGPFNLYGYTLAIDSSKTVKSITLPNNPKVVVVAINLAPIEKSLFQWSFAPKWFRNGGRNFTLIFSGTGSNDSWNSISGEFITTSAVSVNLSAVGNVYALVNDGTRVPSGGIDGWGNAYSETLTGTSISWSGATFALGASGTANGVRARTVPLPTGNYSNVLLLATGVNGKQPNQQFVVTYTDGSSTSLTPQSLSDWYAPLAQHYIGESMVATIAHRVTATGAIQNGPFNLYGYTLAIDSSKTIQSITLPNNRNVVVVAIDLVPLAPAL